MSAYYYLSAYYTELNKDSAEYYGELQLDLAKKLNQKLWEADALFQVAYITYDLGNYPRSLTAITDGLTITDDQESEKNNWKVSTFSGDGNAHRARLFIAAALHQIFAFLYENTGDSPKALSEYLTAIRIAEGVDNKEELSLDYMSFADEYIKVNKLDSALLLENKARNYALQSNYKIYLGAILNIIGDINFLRKNYPAAGNYYKDAMKTSISQNNLKDEIDAFLNISNLKRATGQVDSSLFYSRKALKTAATFGLPSEKRRAYDAIFSAYKLLNNTDSAYAYLQRSKSLGDSLNVVQKAKTNQYQRLNLDSQIRLQESEKAKIQSENKKRVYTLLAGIGVLLLIAFLLFRNIRHRKKANELLQVQKHEIEKQKEKVESTLTELKAAQKQLIQSEKMASLGELTAGIAHEIQNPLNFVNNFSEVSNELIDEMKAELDKGDINEAKFIADDIKQNLEKINQHGKRADAIVKGMLQHSRQTKGLSEPTDINALCDECLKLSYHGLRAKDKSFNADFKTNFDESIGKINIVSQDIGRVLLNIISNAFYATNERQKAEGETFKPLVSVQSKKSNSNVEIIVSDNGTGIPQNITDKIFQPFFTTKPTGQGTGLGLSLAYDIITKEHNGTITVESDEGKGSAFTIVIPVQ